MKNLYIITIAIIASVAVSACKKNESDPAPIIPTQTLVLRMTPKIGADTLDFASTHITANNERYTLSSFRYYMSNISLIKNNGTEEALTGKVFLINPNTSDYSLGNVPAGTYNTIKFSVGLNNELNHGDPTKYPVSNPLAIQSPGIHWSWNSGYIFMMMEGTCDTTDTNVDVLTYGQYSHDLFYHIGTDALLKDVQVSNAPITILPGVNKVVQIHSNINQLFVGVDLKTENRSHTMGSMPLATKIANNIPSMFTIE